MVDPGNFPFHFAFSVSDVLFVSLDATVVGALPEAQMNWLEGLLARTEGKYRARIAFSHLPLWPFAIQRETEIIGETHFGSLRPIATDQGIVSSDPRIPNGRFSPPVVTE